MARTAWDEAMDARSADFEGYCATLVEDMKTRTGGGREPTFSDFSRFMRGASRAAAFPLPQICASQVAARQAVLSSDGAGGAEQ